MTENVPFDPKVQSQEEMQVGMLVCEPGYTYLIIFSNRGISFHPKKLKYSINLETKEDQETTNRDTKKLENNHRPGTYYLQYHFFRTMDQSSDLVGFVMDLMEMDEKRKSDISQNSDGQQKAGCSR